MIFIFKLWNIVSKTNKIEFYTDNFTILKQHISIQKALNITSFIFDTRHDTILDLENNEYQYDFGWIYTQAAYTVSIIGSWRSINSYLLDVYHSWRYYHVVHKNLLQNMFRISLNSMDLVMRFIKLFLTRNDWNICAVKAVWHWG